MIRINHLLKAHGWASALILLFSAPALAIPAHIDFDMFGPAPAAEISQYLPYDQLLTVVAVTTDAFAGTAYLHVGRTDAGEMTHIVYQSVEGKTLPYTLAQLRSGFQILKQMDGRNVILLAVEPDFNEFKGGHAVMRFLYSGASSEYRNFRILLEPAGDKIILRSDPNLKDVESDRNEYTSVFNHLFLKKNTFWGKTIGIKKINPSMQ